MRNFIIFVLIVVASIYGAMDWVKSGKMDLYLQKSKSPSKPSILFYIAETCNVFQEPKSASHYYRWITEEYPDHEKAARVRWELGRCYENLKQKDLAMEQYVILIDSYSVTEYGQMAINRYGQLKY